jgi:hypothetical protein
VTARAARGLELSRRFYLEAIEPILRSRFPRLRHAAALIGSGSEVLGYDDEVSRDHHWGPRVQLFVEKRDLDAWPEINRTLAHELPVSFAGISTNFGEPDDHGVRLLAPLASGPIAHRVESMTVRDFAETELGYYPLDSMRPADWLATPSQALLELTAGDVFADPMGELTAVRETLAWYPHDVWLLVMAGHWRRIAQLEHLHGRAGSRGDEVGSRLIAGSLVRDLMLLGFLHERRYAPYPKWFGTAYAALARPEACALRAALAASDWREREHALAEAYRQVAQSHNLLGVTERLDPEPREFYARGFLVLSADRFVDALRAAIGDDEIRAIDHEAGAVDSVSDNTDVLTRPHVRRRLAPLYDRTHGV